MKSDAIEVNFDGLVGPTHNYAGLSPGNLASQRHLGQPSNPRAAALQGLAKMKLLHELGVKQAVLPPQERPNVGLLRRLGFSGDAAAVLRQAQREAPHLLAASASASSMWAANAATVSPSADADDGRVHFTPANLISHLHRAQETDTTARALRLIFADEKHFAHHDSLPPVPQMGDEGAANHTRLCPRHGEHGVEIFVYGESTGRYPRRQKREASAAIARMHRLDPRRTLLVEQSAEAIDAGVFHNDVIAVGNEKVLFYHEQAFAEGRAAVDRIRRAFGELGGGELVVVEVSAQQLSLADAVSTYLFNSQLVTLPDGSMALVHPIECREHAGAQRVLDTIVASDNPIRHLFAVDTRQSMRNGGGPACLRLRVVLTRDQLASVQPDVLYSPQLHQRLEAWIAKHYRDTLTPAELADPKLLAESRAALEVLTHILNLGAFYKFQGKPE